MKYFVCLVLLFWTSSSLWSQKIEIPKHSEPNPWRIGGELGFSLGNNSTGIHISPSVGYMFTSQLEVGATLAYTYNKYRDYKFNVFSGGVFTNYHIIPELFARGHYEYYTGDRKDNNISDTFHENALWLGAGYQNYGRVQFQAGVLYNVLHDKDNSVFSSPWRPFAGVSIAF